MDHETEDTLFPCENYSQSDCVGQLTQVVNVVAVSKQITLATPRIVVTPELKAKVIPCALKATNNLVHKAYWK